MRDHGRSSRGLQWQRGEPQPASTGPGARWRWLLLPALLLAWMAHAHAQTTHYVQWDPNPLSDAVLYYTLVYDTTSAQTIPPTIDPTCSCVQAPITVSAGSHSVSLTATNQWGTSAATVVTFNANPAGKVANIRIK